RLLLQRHAEELVRRVGLEAVLGVVDGQRAGGAAVAAGGVEDALQAPDVVQRDLVAVAHAGSWGHAAALGVGMVREAAERQLLELRALVGAGVAAAQR